jgi:hypothetical protein
VIVSEIIFTALSGSGGDVEMAEDDESIVSTLVVELDPETSSPRNLIIPRLSVGAPPDMGSQVQAEKALEGQPKEQRVNQVPDLLRDYLPEQLSLVLGVQVYHELWERVQLWNVLQNLRKLLLQTMREERNIRRLGMGQVGYVEDEDEVIDRELNDFGILGDSLFLAA